MTKILLVTNWFPYPPINGAKIRTYNLIRQLSNFADIDLISLVRTLDSKQLRLGKNQIEKYCDVLDIITAVTYTPGKTSYYKKLVDPLPDSIRNTININLENALCSAIKQNSYDVFWICENGGPSILTYSSIKLGLRPLILDSLELGSLRPKGAFFSTQRIKTILTWLKARCFTHRLLQSADAISVSSKKELQLFKSLIPPRTYYSIIPNGVELNDYRGNFGERDRFRLIHTGSFTYNVNYEGVKWFAEQVFPKIRMNNDLKIELTGITGGRDLSPITRNIPQAEFPGLVDDIRPKIARSRISIVPVWTGGSTRLKIAEAMALRTPVVSTRLGAEGLDVCDGNNILIADNPTEFAKHIERLIEDDVLWEKLSLKGYELIQQKYSTEIMGKKLFELYESVVS